MQPFLHIGRLLTAHQVNNVIIAGSDENEF